VRDGSLCPPAEALKLLASRSDPTECWLLKRTLPDNARNSDLRSSDAWLHTMRAGMLSDGGSSQMPAWSLAYQGLVTQRPRSDELAAGSRTVRDAAARLRGAGWRCPSAPAACFFLSPSAGKPPPGSGAARRPDTVSVAGTCWSVTTGASPPPLEDADASKNGGAGAQQMGAELPRWAEPPPQQMGAGTSRWSEREHLAETATVMERQLYVKGLNDDASPCRRGPALQRGTTLIQGTRWAWVPLCRWSVGSQQMGGVGTLGGEPGISTRNKRVARARAVTPRHLEESCHCGRQRRRAHKCTYTGL
jgi:hypothetical protein